MPKRSRARKSSRVSGSQRPSANMPRSSWRIAGPQVRIAAQDDLGVGPAVEACARRLEPRANAGEVVDLAVEGDPAGEPAAAHRLRAGARRVDDREPACERGAAPDCLETATRSSLAPDALAVRAAMADRRKQPLTDVAAHIRREPRIEEEPAGNAAHVRVPAGRWGGERRHGREEPAPRSAAKRRPPSGATRRCGQARSRANCFAAASISRARVRRPSSREAASSRATPDRSRSPTPRWPSRDRRR